MLVVWNILAIVNGFMVGHHVGNLITGERTTLTIPLLAVHIALAVVSFIMVKREIES